MVSINALIEYYNVDVHSFSVSKNFTYIPPNTDKFYTYKLSDYNKKELMNVILTINPEIIVVSGWFISEYVWVSKKIKNKLNIPIVSYSDTQWRGDWSQRINSMISPFHLKKAFSHIWASGVYQYEYARKLGFSKDQIIFNSLSCDIKKFQELPLKSGEDYPKNFIYIGRFAEEKGLGYLLEAWGLIENLDGWTLTLIGDGELKKEFLNKKNVIVKDFMKHEELRLELNKSGCFILPSIYEPWALVIHEAAASGLPIICTEVCGAAPHFVIDGFNGCKVKPENSLALKQAMERIIKMNFESLENFSKRSRELAQNITPERGAANLMSLLLK
ncbi:glycosyltransferase family 4 protein [uncultured Gelidibacter sp.]|uniref:glycosyltransferase family 4 protein n=1 Tax=uncultured Gelidibacter sp. TaxID=259318 RepID=UPI002607E2CF|nr:glycosyltransferase family 4 protein [uncultured Gelidibacter sp.]